MPPQADAFERQMSTFDHLYYPPDMMQTTSANSYRPQTSPKINESSYYTIKYLGITNGEIGILSQRKPLTSPKSTVRNTVRPSTQQSVRSNLVSQGREWDQGPQTKAQPPFGSEVSKDLFPVEFLRPNPERYDEYLVHTYTRPHPLNCVRKASDPHTHYSAVTTTLASDISKYSKTFVPVHPVKPERRGVSGWKLTRPKSQGCIPKPRISSLPVKEKRETIVLKPNRPTTKPGVRGEAYIEYLLLKKTLKSRE